MSSVIFKFKKIFNKVNLLYIFISLIVSIVAIFLYHRNIILKDNPYTDMSDFIYGTTVYVNYDKSADIFMIFLYIAIFLITYAMLMIITYVLEGSKIKK